MFIDTKAYAEGHHSITGGIPKLPCWRLKPKFNMFTMFIDAGSRDFLKVIKWCCSLAYIIIYFKFILEANIFLQQAIIYFTKKKPR